MIRRNTSSRNLFHMNVLGIIAFALVLVLAGCEMAQKTVSETAVDEQLTQGASPQLQEVEPMSAEPRPEFKQEPPKSQNP